MYMTIFFLEDPSWLSSNGTVGSIIVPAGAYLDNTYTQGL